MKHNLRTQAVRYAFQKRTYAIDPKLRNRLLVTKDYDSASYVISIEQLVHEIFNSNKMIFSIGKNELGRHTIACKNPDLLKAIHSCITFGLAGEIAFSFPIHKFNPYVNRFIKVKDKLGCVLGMALSRYNEYDRDDELAMTVDMLDKLMRTVDILNEFIDRIRRKDVDDDEKEKEVKVKVKVKVKEEKKKESLKFKKLIANYQNNIIKKNRGLVDYINYLFDQYSSLLVLRVDFGYTINYCKDKDEIDKMYEQAQKDRKNFINDKPISIFEHRVGCVWKLEYCRMKGFYYQMFFFFDGAKVQLDINSAMKIGDDIGEYWVNTIKQGKGLYLNYNDPKSKYRWYPGIGMINRDDHNRRNELEKAVEDLIMPDYYAKMDAPGKEKTYSRGEVLKP